MSRLVIVMLLAIVVECIEKVLGRYGSAASVQTRYGGRTVNQTDHPYLTAAMAVILLLTVQALPLLAAEPVTLVVEGIEGDVLKNVQGGTRSPPRIGSRWDRGSTLARTFQEAGE